MMAHDELITGTITNQETGQTSDVEHMLFPNDATLNCIVFIKDIQAYHYEENGQWEITAACACLDAIGFVYDLECVWQPETIQENNDVLATIDSGNYYTAVGRFGGYVDGAFYLYDPKCEPLPAGIKEKAADAFRINGKEQE